MEFDGVSASFINNILFFTGGLAGATLIYFATIIYFYAKNEARQKRIEHKIDELLRKV